MMTVKNNIDFIFLQILKDADQLLGLLKDNTEMRLK